MEEAISKKEDSFTCPVCLDLLKDPVAIACGHNFCMGCIKGCWDQEDEKGIYSCPLCKQTFTPRPVLSKNSLIAEMVEKFRKTRIQAPAQCYAEPGDVECDVCTGRKLKAVKSCLECLVSYCESHLKVHNEAHPRKHSVIDVTSHLQERICVQHKKPLEMFCRTDKRFVCFLCKMYEHKTHNTVTTEEERTEKQKHLGDTQRKFHQRLQEREKELLDLRTAVETLKSSAQTAVEDSERIFTEIIHSIERRRSEVTELIRAQEKAELSRAEGLLKQLEQEIAELKRRDAELEQLLHTDDHVHFLLYVQSGNLSPQFENLPSMTFNQSFPFEAVKESVSALKMQLEEKLDILHSQQIQEISATVAKVQIIQSSKYSDPEAQVTRTDTKQQLPSDKRTWRGLFSTEAVANLNFRTRRISTSPTSLSAAPRIRGDFSLYSDPEPPVTRTDTRQLPPSEMSRSPTSLSTGPRTRQEFLAYLCHLTLDANTANRNLHLSAGNTMVEGKDKMLSHPDHPERFDNWAQVLCREGVSGRCYWEIEWSGTVDIAVSYKTISRKGQGDDSRFGWNRCSWKLCLTPSRSLFKHNNKEYDLCLVRTPRIGVYVDHNAGTLAFYSITDTVTLLHGVQTTFTHTLYPGFWVSEGSSVKLL